jgi:CheY-like chemotaxis protein
MNVVICEDNVLIAMDLAEMVSAHGHTVEATVDSSTDCLERCSESPPDLVVTDLNLADGRTGLDLVEALAGQGIPAVIVSSEASSIPASIPAMAILEKPVHECELTMTLDRLEQG